MQTENMKLRKAIRDANDSFAQGIKSNGHLVRFADLPVIPAQTTEAIGLPHDHFEPATATLMDSFRKSSKEADETLEDTESVDFKLENMRPHKV